MAENSALIPEPTTMYTNKEALKDVKDLSKNLMSGDFERQYNGSESGRKRKGCVMLGVTVGALAVWLLVLTIVREIQLTQLRQEVDQLSANMIAMSANVMSLNQKLSSNRLFNEFKTLEDTIYADEDQEGNLVNDSKDLDKDTPTVESLDKLSGLTVLEDESMLDDDEDMYDGDEDAESGDWYPDYDRRREKVGTTNMVRLKPEDFTDSVSKQDISKISHLLNENPEMTDLFPAMAASPSTTEASREKRSLLSVASTENDFIPSVSKYEERRKIKKFFPSESTKPSTQTVSRTARNSNEQGRRPFIAAHFHGNTSHLSPEIHDHYKGNGLVRVSHGAPHDVWYPAGWTLASPDPRPSLTRSGHVHVHHTGVYLVYVQVGTTNMVRLKPEDFTDSVSKQDISKISHLLNENPEMTDLFPAMAASPSTTEASREKRSLLSVASTENDFIPSVSKYEERRKIKKFFPSESTKPSTQTVSRTARNSNEQGRRPFIAAHFHGNTSHLSPEIHDHYKGNGLVRVSHGAPHDVWYPAGWTLASPDPRPSLTRSGHVHVHHTGVYLVYVQIYYLDNHDVISWVLHRTGAYSEGREPLLQCAQSAHSSDRLDKPNSCFSASALFLRAGDRLAVRNTGGDRHSLMQPEKSFIGLIKLADAEEPDDEM